MNIIDNMGLLPKKRGSNQHKTKRKVPSKGKSIATIIVCLVAVSVIIYAYNAYETNPTIFKQVLMGKVTQAQEIVQPQNTDALTAEERANLQKQYELSEREIVLLKEKQALEKDYNTKHDAMEKELGEIRKAKTSFTSAPKQ